MAYLEVTRRCIVIPWRTGAGRAGIVTGETYGGCGAPLPWADADAALNAVGRAVVAVLGGDPQGGNGALSSMAGERTAGRCDAGGRPFRGDQVAELLERARAESVMVAAFDKAAAGTCCDRP